MDPGLPAARGQGFELVSRGNTGGRRAGARAVPRGTSSDRRLPSPGPDTGQQGLLRRHPVAARETLGTRPAPGGACGSSLTVSPGSRPNRCSGSAASGPSPPRTAGPWRLGDDEPAARREGAAHSATTAGARMIGPVPRRSHLADSAWRPQRLLVQHRHPAPEPQPVHRPAAMAAAPPSSAGRWTVWGSGPGGGAPREGRGRRPTGGPPGRLRRCPLPVVRAPRRGWPSAAPPCSRRAAGWGFRAARGRAPPSRPRKSPLAGPAPHSRLGLERPWPTRVSSTDAPPDGAFPECFPPPQRGPGQAAPVLRAGDLRGRRAPGEAADGPHVPRGKRQTSPIARRSRCST